MKHYLDELFSSREYVGEQIKKIMDKKNITKVALCNKTNISRPTLDKIIEGDVSNKTTFDKHVSKILNILNVSEEELFIRKPNVKEIRNKLRITREDISKATGIELSRLSEIENGEEATLIEYRDIAMCLGTSIASLKNKSIFENTNSNSLAQICPERESDTFGSFWGHVGVCDKNSKDYKWYPISGNTRNAIYRNINNRLISIPCMNNKLLFLNMNNIKEIYLLDEALDQPDDANWNRNVSEGEIPLVIYESLEDYIYDHTDEMSDNFKRTMKALVKKYKINEDNISEFIDRSIIYFADGTRKNQDIEFGLYENISGIIHLLNDWDDEFEGNIIQYCEIEGAEHILPLSNIAFIELPLLRVEEAINKLIEEDDNLI